MRESHSTSSEVTNPFGSSARFLHNSNCSLRNLAAKRRYSSFVNDVRGQVNLKEKLLHFISPCVLETLKEFGKKEDFRDTSQMRNVTTVFLNFQISRKVLMTENAKAAEQENLFFQSIFSHTLEILNRAEHNGMVRQFLVDDKGCNLIVVFGTPTFTHMDDPLRAVRFVHAVKNEIQYVKIGCGITTDKVSAREATPC